MMISLPFLPQSLFFLYSPNTISFFFLYASLQFCLSLDLSPSLSNSLAFEPTCFAEFPISLNFLNYLWLCTYLTACSLFLFTHTPPLSISLPLSLSHPPLSLFLFLSIPPPSLSLSIYTPLSLPLSLSFPVSLSLPITLSSLCLHLLSHSLLALALEQEPLYFVSTCLNASLTNLEPLPSSSNSSQVPFHFLEQGSSKPNKASSYTFFTLLFLYT